MNDERVTPLIKTTLRTRPARGCTHWSVCTVAAETGISKISVKRYVLLFGLQPHRTESFKRSIDPFFLEKPRPSGPSSVHALLQPAFNPPVR